MLRHYKVISRNYRHTGTVKGYINKFAPARDWKGREWLSQQLGHRNLVSVYTHPYCRPQVDRYHFTKALN